MESRSRKSSHDFIVHEFIGAIKNTPGPEEICYLPILQEPNPTGGIHSQNCRIARTSDFSHTRPFWTAHGTDCIVTIAVESVNTTNFILIFWHIRTILLSSPKTCLSYFSSRFLLVQLGRPLPAPCPSFLASLRAVSRPSPNVLAPSTAPVAHSRYRPR